MRRSDMASLLFGLTAVLWSTGTISAETLTVFVSILPQKTMVERIAGPDARVLVMVRPGRSPATYEPTPRQMQALTEASLYFRVGVAFEEAWIERIQEIHPGLRMIDTRQGITLRPLEDKQVSLKLETGTHGQTGQGHAHPLGRLDPHFWLDPNLVKIQARTMFEALAQERPQNRETYQKHLEQLLLELSQLDGELRAMLSGLTDRRFLVFHPSWGYFAAAYDLEQIAIEQGGKEPGPRSLARLIEYCQAQDLRTILVQKQFSDRSARAVARAVQGRVLAVDPLAADYFANLKQVVRILAGESP